MSDLHFVPFKELDRVRKSSFDKFRTAQLFADLCRVNALYMIMQAGSGHIGSSFSSLDIVSWLYLNEMRLPRTLEEFRRTDHDIYFSSKGHDAPGLYAVLIGLGLLGEEQLNRLRRLDGLPGHPDVGTPFIEANTGSLGMGLSKATGMVLANRWRGKRRKVFLLTGDGEWQEGQIWEALSSAANRGLHEITLIVDHNKIQSDSWVEKVGPLGDFEKKLALFGWRVFRCDGHHLIHFSEAIKKSRNETKNPTIIIADTVKGKGVSFMQGDALRPGERLYRFHSGAPDFELYEKAFQELGKRIEESASSLALRPIQFHQAALLPRQSISNPQRLVDEYAKALVHAAEKHPDLVVLDADLALDCGLLPFETKYPARFIECGIAEQDMVSMAGGLALQGLLPVVHSFASFLTARANEQLFVNATEHTKIIYVGSLAGLLPSSPGHSHQAVRDISVLAAIPDLCLVAPCCREELEAAFSWAVEENSHSTYLRLSSVPWEVSFRLPPDYRLKKGRGVALNTGKDAALFAYGPVMLSEAWNASLRLKQKYGIELQVINLPWLNEVDHDWLKEVIAGYRNVFMLDDHLIKGGQGQMLAARIGGFEAAVQTRCFGVEGIPFCGQNREVLKAHGLDGEHLADRIVRELDANRCFS